MAVVVVDSEVASEIYKTEQCFGQIGVEMKLVIMVVAAAKIDRCSLHNDIYFLNVSTVSS